VEVRPIQSNLYFFLLNKKTRVFERACIVAKKGALCPIFEGDMPPKKYTPKKWPFIDGHSMKAVNSFQAIFLLVKNARLKKKKKDENL
jgi:hypothetical protein